jgi:hypothetical protein
MYYIDDILETFSYAHIHASRGIRTNDPSVGAAKTHALDRMVTVICSF